MKDEPQISPRKSAKTVLPKTEPKTKKSSVKMEEKVSKVGKGKS